MTSEVVSDRSEALARGYAHAQQVARRHLPLVLAQECFEAWQVDVALEGMLGLRTPRDLAHQVHGRDTELLEVGARGVEVVVRRDELAGLALERKQQMFGCPTLVCGNQVLVAGDSAHHLLETVVAA